MTEAEWLASDDPAEMGAFVSRKRRANARVLRLYLAAFWGWQAHRLATPDERELLRRRAAVVALWAETGRRPAEATAPGVNLVFFNRSAKDGFLSTVRAPSGWVDGRPATRRAVWTLRELFGNPFTAGRKREGEPRRGWMFEPCWRTDTATLLARQMYEANDFTAMPILADALQDAGCDNRDLLDHLRGAHAGEPQMGPPMPPPGSTSAGAGRSISYSGGRSAPGSRRVRPVRCPEPKTLPSGYLST